MFENCLSYILERSFIKQALLEQNYLEQNILEQIAPFKSFPVISNKHGLALCIKVSSP